MSSRHLIDVLIGHLQNVLINVKNISKLESQMYVYDD